VKTRDSGMPDEELWASFFAPAKRLAMLGLNAKVGNAVDFGCGYGTFAVPAAKVARGIVYALDIDPASKGVNRLTLETYRLRKEKAAGKAALGKRWLAVEVSSASSGEGGGGASGLAVVLPGGAGSKSAASLIRTR
jgi:hypothetical protein